MPVYHQDAQEYFAAAMDERELQRQVLKLAGGFGWHAYHTWDSRHSAAGFPDLVLLRGGQLVVAELKREKGRVTSDQVAWLDEFGKVRGAHAHIWRPSDLMSGAIERALK